MADVVVDTAKTPVELLAQGVKAYVLQDFTAAVAALSKASEMLVTEHGDDVHESLGEVYLYYGKALLGLSREENEALGDAVPRNNDEDSSDEDEEQEAENGEENGDEKEEKAETEVEGAGNVAATTNGKAATSNGEAETSNGEAAASKGEASPTNEASKDEASGSIVDPEKKEAENEDDPTDLQVAWEVLELAKKIFQNKGEEGKKNLAETLTVLGEISLESENFASAVSDIKEGLDIQKQLFGSDSRTVAESFYKLGVAQSTNSEIDEAVQSFQSSLEYLRNRVALLEKMEEGREEAEEELREIKGLVPDIEEKIADMKSYKEEALKKIVSAVTGSKSSDGPSTSSAIESKPVTNISHLVKRKRKADEIADENDISQASPNKKVNL